jgi:SP family sugar:H+ symporter-like MFS transporter
MTLFKKGSKREHSDEANVDHVAHPKDERITFLACFLGLVASIGGFMFGYVR